MKKLTTNKFRVMLFEKLMGFASILQNISSRTTPPPFRLMQIGSVFWQSRALYVATRLGVADVIADTEKNTQDIAAELQLDEDHLYRLLRMLQAMAIFEEVSPRVFKNSRASAFLRQDNPQNVRAMILMHNSPQMTLPWMEALEESIHDGGVPFAKVHGVGLFDYMDQNKDFDLLFSQAMDAVESLTGTSYLDDFNWGAFDRIIDVGGSRGSKSMAILKSFPALNAVVFDRPQIIATARDSWRGKVPAELLTRIDFEPGDMFTGLPAAISDNDLYIFFAVFHGLSDEEANIVLEQLKRAAGSQKPHILIVDTVADEMQLNPILASFDMQMLIGTRGRERTMGEWTRLFTHAGFKLIEIIDVRTFVKFIVIRPA